jgi:hypothetical protein
VQPTLPSASKKSLSVVAELQNYGHMNSFICRFLLVRNYDHFLKFKTCDRCRYNKPPGSLVSSGVADTTALGTSFQQSDKRNMGGIVTLPACYQ